MNNDVKHLFLCLFPICLFSLLKYLCFMGCLPILKLGCCSFIGEFSECFIYSRDKPFAFVKYVLCNIIIQVCIKTDASFQHKMFHKWKVFIFDEVKFINFYFYGLCFDVKLRWRPWRFFPRFLKFIKSIHGILTDKIILWRWKTFMIREKAKIFFHTTPI